MLIYILRKLFIMANDMFNNIPDPLARLEELEIIATGQGMAMENISEQLQNQAYMIEQLSGSLVELAQALNSQHRILMDQAKHIKRLEKDETR